MLLLLLLHILELFKLLGDLILLLQASWLLAEESLKLAERRILAWLAETALPGRVLGPLRLLLLLLARLLLLKVLRKEHATEDLLLTTWDSLTTMVKLMSHLPEKTPLSLAEETRSLATSADQTLRTNLALPESTTLSTKLKVLAALALATWTLHATSVLLLEHLLLLVLMVKHGIHSAAELLRKASPDSRLLLLAWLTTLASTTRGTTGTLVAARVLPVLLLTRLLLLLAPRCTSLPEELLLLAAGCRKAAPEELLRHHVARCLLLLLPHQHLLHEESLSFRIHIVGALLIKLYILSVNSVGF